MNTSINPSANDHPADPYALITADADGIVLVEPIPSDSLSAHRQAVLARYCAVTGLPGYRVHLFHLGTEYTAYVPVAKLIQLGKPVAFLGSVDYLPAGGKHRPVPVIGDTFDLAKLAAAEQIIEN